MFDPLVFEVLPGLICGGSIVIVSQFSFLNGRFTKMAFSRLFRARSAAVGVSLALLLASSAVPLVAGAEPKPRQDPASGSAGFVVESPSEAAQRDARMIAKATGRTEEQAATDGAAANQFAVAMASVQANVGRHVLAGSSWTNGRGIVELSREASEADVALVKKLLGSAPAEVIRTSKLPEAVLVSVQHSLVRRLMTGPNRDKVTMVDLDVSTGVITVIASTDISARVATAADEVAREFPQLHVPIHSKVADGHVQSTGDVVGVRN